MMLRFFLRLIGVLRTPGPEVGRRKPWLRGIHRCRHTDPKRRRSCRYGARRSA